MSVEATKVKPMFRGTSHALGFFIAAYGCVVLAGATQGSMRNAGLVHGLSLMAMLGVSGLYHQVNWSMRARQWWRRIDHATIYALIAGSLTPYAVMVGGGEARWWLWLYWAAALGSAVFAAFVDHGLRWLRAGLNVAVGLLCTPVVWHLPQLIGMARVGVLLASSAIYIAGAVVYARRWPNPNPRIFGYHEVFHLMVVLAAAMQYGVTLSVLRELGAQ